EPVKVIVVGTFHMSNPGHDIHNMKVDDVLAAKRQAEIADVTDRLAAFKPTKVMAEWPAELVAERYPKYVAGTLPPSRNEVVQLGFRLARSAGAQGMYGIDVDGDFPFEAVQTFAKAHGQEALLQSWLDAGGREVKALTEMLASHSIGATLRSMNDPARTAADHGFYREMLRIGAGEQQPGVDLVIAWYKRNFRICANLIQLAKPGDRIIVFYGAGHAFLLRECAQQTPGLELVEANQYLPQK
ncbi:MAG TPA: DUF5694 domain-containing protein, partial [Myxococcales bacterium]|nr:DUF5694 domain-containing protein [Myxococcales bacterium]